MSTRTKLVLDAVTHSQPTMCAEKIGTIFFEGGSIQVLDILDIKPMADALVNISSFVDITRHLFSTTFSAHMRPSQVTLQHRNLYISVLYVFALEQHKQSCLIYRPVDRFVFRRLHACRLDTPSHST